MAAIGTLPLNYKEFRAEVVGGLRGIRVEGRFAAPPRQQVAKVAKKTCVVAAAVYQLGFDISGIQLAAVVRAVGFRSRNACQVVE